jgi:hypothetical protein
MVGGGWVLCLEQNYVLGHPKQAYSCLEMFNIHAYSQCPSLFHNGLRGTRFQRERARPPSPSPPRVVHDEPVPRRT